MREPSSQTKRDVRAVVAKTERYEVRESGLVAGMANLIDRAQLADPSFPAHGAACVARRGTDGVWYVTTPLGHRRTRRSATTADGLARAVLAIWGGDETQLREVASLVVSQACAQAPEQPPGREGTSC